MEICGFLLTLKQMLYYYIYIYFLLRSSKEVSSKRKQSVDGSKRLDPTQIAMPENNVAIHQQPHPQQQWLPPPQDVCKKKNVLNRNHSTIELLFHHYYSSG